MGEIKQRLRKKGKRRMEDGEQKKMEICALFIIGDLLS